LVKIAPSGGRREHFWGISCEKSRFYAKKIIFFPLLGGGGGATPPGDSHINNITTKANKTLGFLRRNTNISTTKVKEHAYKSLVRPSLEYACSVWDPYTKEDITQLEQVQRRAARYVTNRYHKTSSASNMIEHLNWRINRFTNHFSIHS
jgi:hypothetical protein